VTQINVISSNSGNNIILYEDPCKIESSFPTIRQNNRQRNML